jgi:hypothetical protein
MRKRIFHGLTFEKSKEIWKWRFPIKNVIGQVTMLLDWNDVVRLWLNLEIELEHDVVALDGVIILFTPNGQL